MKNACPFVAPKTLAASIREKSNFSITAYRGKIANGKLVYTEISTTALVLYKNCKGSSIKPNLKRIEFKNPLFPKTAIQAYILIKKFVQNGNYTRIKCSFLFFDLAI